jgi:protein O-mannosyl-transferase
VQEADGGEQVTAPPLAAAALLLALLCAALYAQSPSASLLADGGGASPHVLRGLDAAVRHLGVRSDHAVAVALHALVALLVFALGRALLARPWAALAGAALFAAHPLQVEAVILDAQRATLLAALFGLAAIHCYVRGRTGRRAVWWPIAVACWLLALDARASAIAVLPAIALCEWLLRGGGARGALAFAAALFAAIAWLGIAPALALHESLVVWPLPARMNAAHEIGGSALAALALQALLLGAAVAGARRYRVVSFALLWFLLQHAVAAAVEAGSPAAEHRNYLALAGPALGAAWLVYAPLERRLGLATALAVFAAGALGVAADARVALWRDPFALWDDAVNKSPHSALARIERGALFDERGRGDEALADLEEAVRLAPDSALAHARLAACLASFGRTDEALAQAREAVALDPGDAASQAWLGALEMKLGDPAAAAAAFEQSLAVKPSPDLERRLGDALVLLGRFEDSIGHYDAALARDPGNDEARTGAGAALVELGRAQDAIPYLEAAVESQPNPHYLVHMADALWQTGDQVSAIDMVQVAVRFGSEWHGATSRLVWMLAVTTGDRRDPERALRVADAALKRANSDAILLDARAAALAALGRFDEAAAQAQSAAEAAADPAFAAAIRERAASYVRREVWRDPPRPFEPSP